MLHAHVILAVLGSCLWTGVAAGQPPRREGGASMEPWIFDPATLQPFTEGKKYRDEFETGLYPGGKNEMPQAHRQAGQRIAATIRPLDVDGAADERNGRVLALVLGHSSDDAWDRSYFTDGVHPAAKALEICVDK